MPTTLPRRAARLLLALALGAMAACGGTREQIPETHEPMLRLTTRSGDGIFLLTSYWQKSFSSRGSPRSSFFHVDLWRFDAATLRPVWRKRLLTEKGGNRLGLRLVGAERGTLWVYAKGLLAIDAESGRLLADSARLLAANPALDDVLPKEDRFVTLDGRGLRLVAMDGRVWRIDPERFTGTAIATGPGDSARPVTPDQGIVLPGFWAPTSTSIFQQRGVRTDSIWLGLFAESEAQAFGKGVRLSTEVWSGQPWRYRLYGARIRKEDATPPEWPKDWKSDWGTRDVACCLARKPRSAEFLDAGVLTSYRHDDRPPILVRDPDGVLILHRDRMGDDGYLVLTRVAADDGHTVWDTALPLSILQSTLPGRENVVLVGRAYNPARDKVGDPYHTAFERLVSVDYATGKFQVFDFTRQGAAVEPEPLR